MKKFILLLSLIYFGHINAQTWVVIPDANFVTYLQSKVPAAMQGDSLNTSSTLVTTTTHTINVRAKNITNLFGLQYFTSLTNLDCSQNSLTSLPALPNTLVWLWASNNSLTSLPTLPTSLQILFADTNQLTSIPSLPANLVSLYVATNNLTSIPTLPNSINYFGCDYNPITSLPALPTFLIYLYCQHCNLTNLPPLPNTLTRLYCYFNNLTSLPLLPNSLQRLYCDHNNIACFPVFPNSISSSYFNIHNNPYNCLPNYIAAMGNDTTIYPICAAGNSNGCPVANGIEQLNSNPHVTVYPNPASDQFFIDINSSDKQIVNLYDVNGKLVLSANVNDRSNNISVTSLNEGVYTMTIRSVERETNKKIVILR